jgi:hypothetical protein
MRARVIPNRRRPSVKKFIDENVSKEATALFTDEAPVYKGLRDSRHAFVRHEPTYEWTPDAGLKPGKREWVRGDVHTNTVEGVHSLLKRSIIGSFIISASSTFPPTSMKSSGGTTIGITSICSAIPCWS